MPVLHVLAMYLYQVLSSTGEGSDMKYDFNTAVGHNHTKAHQEVWLFACFLLVSWMI